MYWSHLSCSLYRSAVTSSSLFLLHSEEDAPDAYGTGMAIGEGLKGEIWKGRHANVNILDMEVEPFEWLLNHVRLAGDEEEAPSFPVYLEAALQMLLAYGIQDLNGDDDDDGNKGKEGGEEEDDGPFKTATGTYYEGDLFSKEERQGTLFVWAVPSSSSPSSSPLFSNVVDRLVPDAMKLEMKVRPDRTVVPTNREGPSSLPSSTPTILLVPSIAHPDDVSPLLDQIEALGVEKDNVQVVALVAFMGAITNLSADYEDIGFTIGAVDPAVDVDERVVVPGIGDIFKRYAGEKGGVFDDLKLSAKSSQVHGGQKEDGGSGGPLGWAKGFFGK